MEGGSRWTEGPAPRISAGRSREGTSVAFPSWPGGPRLEKVPMRPAARAAEVFFPWGPPDVGGGGGPRSSPPRASFEPLRGGPDSEHP